MKHDFRKTLVTVEVLHDGPLDYFKNLEELYHMVTTGDCSHTFEVGTSKKLTETQMKKACLKQGSDIAFFKGGDS